MIKAVFLDLFNTICFFDPSREERQQAACRGEGFDVSLAAIQRAYVPAEDYWTLENGRRPIAARPEEERLAFYRQYEQFLLRHAGLELTEEQAAAVYAHYWGYGRRLRLFDDVLPVLIRLRAQGIKVGLISNNDRPVEPTCDELFLTAHLDVALSSFVVGCEKPDRRIFEAALRAVEARPHEAVHIGDQYHSDIVGAQEAGITPVLIDRSGLLVARSGCVRITDLWQLNELLCTLP